ncbi:MAG: dihydrodipicolinate synthase family protein [Rhodothermales bacterium]
MSIDIKKDSFWKPKGVFVATLTPMNEDLSVNIALLTAHCKWLMAHGTDGIVLSGTTGEANSLSVAEKMIMLDELLASGLPAERFIVGTGCCAFPDSVALTRHAVKLGVGGVLMLPPFYYKGVPEDGVFASFEEIIQRVGDEKLQIYLYHFPKMSGVPFSLNLIERLLKAYPDQIAGIKDSSGDFSNMKAMAERFPGFRVFAGTEAFLLDVLRVGGVGCISATTNLTSGLAGKVYENWETESADVLQDHLTSVRLTLQEHAFIPTLKGLMGRITGNTTWHNMRPPHILASQNEIEEVLLSLRQRNFDLGRVGN